MTSSYPSLYDVPVRHRIFFLLFILGIAASWAALQWYQGCPYESETVTGTVYREVWNTENQAVLEPSDRLVRILLTGSSLNTLNGRKVAVQGQLRQPERARNPGGYSQRDYLYGKNVLLVLEVTSITEVSGTPVNGRALGSRVRVHIEQILSKYMDEQELRFLLGVMTGDTSGLEDSEKAWVRLSGLSHLMAVSGMHVTYILMPVKHLVKRKKWDIALRSGLCLVPLAAFTTVAGFTPSVIRAAVMCGCHLVAKIVNRKADFLNTFGLAGCMCLLVYPMAVADTGFVLSFGAVLAGHMLTEPMTRFIARRRKGRKAGRVWDSFCYGLAVNIGLLPVMLYKFNMLSLAGVLIGVAAAPLSAAMCILGYFTCIIGAVPMLEVLAVVFSKSLTTVTGALVILAQGGSKLPVFRTVSPPLWLIGLYYGLLWWLVRGREHVSGRRMLAAVSAAAIIVTVVGIFGRCPVKIIWFDVGQGSCALICTADGTTMLIDGGNGYTNVSSLLWKNGISGLDFVVLSHGDSDHSEGLKAVLEEHSVHYLLVPANPEDEKAMEMAAAAKDKGIETAYLSDIAYVTMSEGIQAELYCRPVRNSFNDSSVVVQLMTASGCVLFPGDLEQKGEQLMAEGNFLRPCDVVTAAHHGAANGTGDYMLDMAKPYFTVISVGRKNRYGHPKEAMLKRLEQRQIDVLRTDTDGAIIMCYGSDGTIGVEKWLQREKLQYRK